VARLSLHARQCEVLYAIRALQKAMAEATPHGRDYQFHPEEYRPARDAWLERVKMIADLREEITEHALTIEAQ